MEELKETTAGLLTRLEIGKPVGVTTESGAYVRDTLIGVIYGAEANRDELGGGLATVTGEGTRVLLAFANTVPAEQHWDRHVGRYYRVQSAAIATVYRLEERRTAGSES